MDELIGNIKVAGSAALGFSITGIDFLGHSDLTLCISSADDPMVLISGEPYESLERDYFDFVDENTSVRYFAQPFDVAAIMPYINAYMGTDIAVDVEADRGNGELRVSVSDCGELIYDRAFELTDSEEILDGTERLCAFLSAYLIALNNHRK